MGEFYVYLWTGSNGKSYVGKGKGDRAYKHTCPSGRSVLAAAIRKHGRDSFTLEFLGTGLSEQEAFDLECSEIEARKCMVPNGYNRSSGGEGASGVVRSAEYRAKLSEALRRAQTPEVRQRKSDRQRGRPFSEEARKNMKAAHNTPEMRAKKSRAHKGRVQSPEWVAKRTAAMSISKRCIPEAVAVNIKFLLLFGARGVDCAEWFGVYRSQVSRINKGRHWSCRPNKEQFLQTGT